MALPRAAGETGKAKAQGTKLSPAWGRARAAIWLGQGTPRLGALSPSCPHGMGAGWLDKAIPQQLKVTGAVLVPSLAVGLGQDGA